jgi:hypothetical protein
MGGRRFAESAEEWIFAESGGPEEFVAYLNELRPEEQRSMLATDGLREALIDHGQEQALRRIESGWSASGGGAWPRGPHSKPVLSL